MLRVDACGVMETDEAKAAGAHDHVVRNQAAWDILSRYYFEPGRRAWQGEIRWGIWGIPEERAHILPDFSGLDIIELGCGTAYLSSWFARRGAHATGIDSSIEQLRTARAFQKEFDVSFPLIQCDAERTPLADASFDLAISEYGASIWCDPYRWIPEAGRLLRPGGLLIFVVGGTILWLCEPEKLKDAPAGTELLRDYFGMRRFESTEDQSVEFHLGYGDWVRLLRANDFQVENLVELRPPEGSTTNFPYVTIDWARRWPSEEVWFARKATSDRCS
jgi:SAM-dependent methyltransferase